MRDTPVYKEHNNKMVTCFGCGEPVHVISRCPRRLAAMYRDPPPRSYGPDSRPRQPSQPFHGQQMGQHHRPILTNHSTPQRAYHGYLQGNSSTRGQRPTHHYNTPFTQDQHRNHGHTQEPQFPHRAPVRPHHRAPKPVLKTPSVYFATMTTKQEHHYIEEALISKNPSTRESGHVNVHHASVEAKMSLATPMMSLTDLDIVPVPKVIEHWLDLCSGGTLVGVLPSLKAGYTIKRVTIVEKNYTIRYVAKQCLLKLTSRFPKPLSWEAIRDSECMTQDVTKISIRDFESLPEVTMVFATPRVNHSRRKDQHWVGIPQNQPRLYHASILSETFT